MVQAFMKREVEKHLLFETEKAMEKFIEGHCEYIRKEITKICPFPIGWKTLNMNNNILQEKLYPSCENSKYP